MITFQRRALGLGILWGDKLEEEEEEEEEEGIKATVVQHSRTVLST